MRVIVIGGGPAGMLAAATVALGGHRVTLLEKNEKLGKKLYITGKGRCNVANAGDREEFFRNVVHNPRFLYSAWSAFDAGDVQRLFVSLGVPLKVERGGRVFPESDKSSDIIRAMQQYAARAGVELRLQAEVTAILAENGRVTGVALRDGNLPADAVILATGGLSYPSTGSTGDGYRFAQALGHTVAPPLPSLVPLETVETWPGLLSGLTLKNVTLRAYANGKQVYTELGEMLLTHFGVSGPLVLTASALLGEAASGAKLEIDLKPGLTEEQLDKRLLRDIEAAPQKSVQNALFGLLPQRLLPVALIQAQIPEKAAGELTRAERRRLLCVLKALPLTVKAARPFSEAVVTRGGVSVKEVQPSTLESKLVKGLYFAGEVLDVDALTGGFNLQIAWSTGALAGLLKGEQE